jgi:hypothetical protein
VTRITRPTRILAVQPDLEQLRRQAKELLEAFASGNAAVSAEVHTHYRDARPETFALHDAQLVIARAYGFDSWPRLKAHVEGLTAKQFISAVRDNDVEAVTAMLKSRPDLVNAQWSYGDERRSLHVAVMNNSPEMVRLLMRAGADARAGIHPHRDATTARTMAFERDLQDIVRIIDEEERSRTPPTGGVKGPPQSPAGATAKRAGVEVAVRSAVARGDSAWLKARHEEHPLTNVIARGGEQSARSPRAAARLRLRARRTRPVERGTRGGVLAGISAVALRCDGQTRTRRAAAGPRRKP